MGMPTATEGGPVNILSSKSSELQLSNQTMHLQRNLLHNRIAFDSRRKACYFALLRKLPMQLAFSLTQANPTMAKRAKG